MTATPQPENNLIVDVRRAMTDWCAFEHWATLQPGEPPQCILVGACKLIDVYKLNDGRNNSQWIKIFANGGSVMIRILITTTDRTEAVNHAVRASRSYNPLPVCNATGYNMRGSLRRIACSNGETYDNQEHAALALGAHQSAISRHLLGHSSHVKGQTLTYIGAD
jgi:hypothetical protein